MDPTSSLDLISKEKVHHFFIFLPLLTLFLIKVNLFILIGYTIIWALAEVYVINLTAFKNLSANAVISPPNPKKTFPSLFLKRASDSPFSNKTMR